MTRKSPVKKPARKKPKRQLVPRTRNSETWTESRYWSAIRSALRNAFRYWKPAQDALKLAERPCGGKTKRQKYEYKCAECLAWFKRTDVQIDHIVEVGSLRGFDDLIPFIQRLTPEDPNAYQILCKECHKIKTNKYKKNGKL